MGQLKGITLSLPGSYGANSQDEIAADQALRFASLASNGVVDLSGKLTSREDFVLQTSGFSDVTDVLYRHPNVNGTDSMMSAASGVIYSGIGTLTSRFDYRAGSQVVDVGGAKTGATATGLANSAEVYGFTVSIDGAAATQISVTGSAAQTYTTLLAEINTDLVGATCVLAGGNLKIISDATGASSSVSITNAAGTASNALISTLTSFVAVRTASAGTVTNDNWQFASLSGKIYAAQAGQYFTCLNETDFAVESIVGQPWTSSPNIIMAGDGRLWAASDAAASSERTIWWSNLLDGKVWNSGDAGSINLINVWPEGADVIRGLAMANGRLIVLGLNTLLLYTMPTDHNPASMTLTDAMTNLGCIARDSVVETPYGVFFLSRGGLYKIPPLTQVTSLLAPLKVSTLIDDEMATAIAAETISLIRAWYYPKQSWYVITFPTSNKTFCVHASKNVPGIEPPVPIITTWTNSAVPFNGFAYDKDGNFYNVMRNGVGKYTGYTSDGASNAYTFEFYTQWLDHGDETKLKHLKKADMTLKAASGQAGTFRWQTDYVAGTVNTHAFTCGAAEFAENPGIGDVSVNIGRSCNVGKYGFTFTINGNAVALHRLRIFANTGATKTTTG